MGCKEEGIRQYTVPEEIIPGAKRLLVVILPHETDTWFLKVVGSPSTVRRYRQEILDFVESVRFPKGEKEPQWKIPKGWEQLPENKKRYATFRFGLEKRPLELRVTRIRRELGDGGNTVLANINRWRRVDLDLTPISESQIPDVSRKLQIGDLSGILVEMTNLEPPVVLRYTRPADWEQAPRTIRGMQLEAAFRVTRGEESAKVSVLRLPGGGGGMLSNVNRWRRVHLGLEPLENADELKKYVTPTRVAGKPADAVDLGGPDTPTRNRVVAVVLDYGGATWFFTMFGSAELVAQQKPNFETFIQSVHFDGGPERL